MLYDMPKMRWIPAAAVRKTAEKEKTGGKSRYRGFAIYLAAVAGGLAVLNLLASLL